jgi:hypothetical protein
MRTKIVASLLLALGAGPALAQKLPPEAPSSYYSSYKEEDIPPFFGSLPAFDCGTLEPQPIGGGMTMQAVRSPFMHVQSATIYNEEPVAGDKTDLCPKTLAVEPWAACIVITLPNKQQFLVRPNNDLSALDGASLKGMSTDQKQRIQGIGYRTIGRCKEAAALTDNEQKRVTCSGLMPKNTYEDIDIPPRVGCTLTDDTVVNGKLLVGKEAKLYVVKAKIARVEADQPAVIQITLATINGDLQIHGGGTSTMITISECDISGKLVITNLDHALFVNIRRNKVGGDLIISKNLVGTATQVTVSDNSIRGNLSCDGNVPQLQTPLGNKNTVGGRKLGQCSHLDGHG